MSLLRQSSIASPPKLLHHGIDLGKIVKNKIGLMLRQLFARAGAGRDRDCSRVDTFAAGDVVRRVADHIDIRSQKFTAMLRQSARLRKATQHGPIPIIVCKSAELEKIPDPVMLEFHFGATRDIAGEEREDQGRTFLQSLQQLQNARQQSSIPLWQCEREKTDVVVQKCADVFVRRGRSVFLENLQDDPRIGSARDLNVAQIIFYPVAFEESNLQRVDSGAARIDECPIDIEKKETSFLHLRYQIEDGGMAVVAAKIVI